MAVAIADEDYWTVEACELQSLKTLAVDNNFDCKVRNTYNRLVCRLEYWLSKKGATEFGE